MGYILEGSFILYFNEHAGGHISEELYPRTLFVNPQDDMVSDSQDIAEFD